MPLRIVPRRRLRRLRALLFIASDRYGIYVHKQWGKDTEGNPGWATDVDLSATTVVRGRDALLSLFEHYRDRLPLTVRDERQLLESLGEALFDDISVPCIEHAFIDAGMKASNVSALLSGLNLDYYASEVRVESLKHLGFREAVDFPCVRAVMRIFNHRQSSRSGSSYEYFVDYDHWSCTVCGDYDIGQSWKRRGKRGGQTTLGEYS